LNEELTQAALSETGVQKLICNSFAVLFKSAADDQQIWDALKQSSQTQKLLFTLLLAERRPRIRKGVAETIFAICGSPPPNKPTKAMDRKEISTPARIPSSTAVDVVASIWKSLSTILPQACEYVTYSQEFFEVTIAVFQTVASLSPGDLIFGEYLRQWSEILLNYKTLEVRSFPSPALALLGPQGSANFKKYVGRETVDFVVLGFTLLLKTCLDLAKTTMTALDT
jgi:ubiquitin carboxyl-terminal hydrolase 34